MATRVKETLGEIRKSLEKLLNDETEDERIRDELAALAEIPMTPELIKDSKLGKIILNIREKYDSKDANISNQAKSILIGWKNIIEKHKHVASSSSAVKDDNGGSKTDTHKGLTSANVAKFNLSTSVSSPSKPDMKAYISQLPATRAAIVNVFSNIFKASANPAMSDSIAVGIEEAMQEQFPLDSSASAKHYNVKAKLLSFNIKKNQVCDTFLTHTSHSTS